MSRRISILIAIVLTAVVSSGLTAYVDQKRWDAHERQQQEDAQREMTRIEDRVRAMNIHEPK